MPLVRGGIDDQAHTPRQPGRGARTLRHSPPRCSSPRPVHAQSGGDGFLFKPPSGTVAFRTGFDHASAGSDLFAFTTEQLTVDRGDFSAPTIAGDVSIRLSRRADVMISVAHSQSRTRSEFRDWLDNSRLPIEQTTTFQPSAADRKPQGVSRPARPLDRTLRLGARRASRRTSAPVAA